MSDHSIIKDIEKSKKQQEDFEHPLTDEEKLETGLEDSMDASDPAAVTAPGDHGDPVPSSGFPEKRDRK